MVIARELALRHWRVTILERSHRLGGKAGSDVHNGWRVEHGYHVFPRWYPNVRAIVDRIGVKLVDFDGYHVLRPGEFPRTISVLAPSGLRAIWHDMFRGIVPWYHMALSFYSVIDIASRPLSEKRMLDQVSHVGLLRGKWYISDTVAELGHENLLKASAIPAYDASAMTVRRMMGYWIRQPSPFLSVLPGDLQEVFIEPQVRELEALGVEIRYGAEVTGVSMRGGAVEGIELSDGTSATGNVFALCVPFEVARRWVNGELYSADPELGNMHFLEAQPMAALHLRLRTRLPEFPREHVFLHGGRYGLSFIDLTQTWKDAGPGTVLSFISSNYGPLSAVDPVAAKDALLEEIREYLPIPDSEIDAWHLNANVNVPLFINTIGAWANRPRPRTRAKNLYLAGDFVKNEIDLACMEGAVFAGLECSRSILRDQGAAAPLPVAVVPPSWPRALMVALRIGMIPAVAVLRAIAWCEDTFFPKRPDYSEVRKRGAPRLQSDPRPPRKRPP